MPDPVLLDTMVFTALLRRTGAQRERLEAYRDHLDGRPHWLCFQTVAEARFGAEIGGWQLPARHALELLIGERTIVPYSEDLVGAYARLKAACQRSAHPLAQKIHTGDLWIATVAVHYDVECVSHDAVFMQVPGLRLLTALVAPQP